MRGRSEDGTSGGGKHTSCGIWGQWGLSSASEAPMLKWSEGFAQFSGLISEKAMAPHSSTFA